MFAILIYQEPSLPPLPRASAFLPFQRNTALPAPSTIITAGLQEMCITPLPPPGSLGGICSLGPEMPSLGIWPELNYLLARLSSCGFAGWHYHSVPSSGLCYQRAREMTWLRMASTGLALHSVPGTAQLCTNLIFCTESESSWTLALDSRQLF